MRSTGGTLLGTAFRQFCVGVLSGSEDNLYSNIVTGIVTSPFGDVEEATEKCPLCWTSSAEEA